MAAATVVGAVRIMAGYIVLRVDWTQAMFGPRWFIVFLPLVLFWAGAWLRKRHHAVQIFGTDIHDSALEKARAGVYAEAIESEISAERLRRFFQSR